MADLGGQRDQLWLSAMRQVGQHFSKIGEIILKCAEETETLTTPHLGRASIHPKSTIEPPGREGIPFSSRRRSPDDPVRGTASASYRPAETVKRFPAPERDTGEPSSYHPRYSSLKDRHFAKPTSRIGRTPGHVGEEEENDDDEMLSERFRGRKRASASGERLSFEERQRREPYLPFSRTRASRPLKRVRMNWTDAENATFFDTIRRYATEDDNSVLHRVVTALGGARTLIQCKGHFRNMLVVGKVIQSETEPRRWIVVEDPEQKRTSIGGRSIQTDSKNSRSSGASKDDPPSGHRDRDDPDDDRLKGSRNEEGGQGGQQEDKPIDEEDDVVLDDIEDDDERDKDYQDEEAIDEEGNDDENESGTNNTAVRVTDVSEIDPGGGGGDYGTTGIGSSVRNMEDGAGKSSGGSGVPLKKQPSGRVGDVAASHSIHDKKHLH